MDSKGSYTYYIIEPGIKYPAVNNLDVIVKYRYRNSFALGKNEETTRIKIGVDYHVSSKSYIETSLARSLGDTYMNSFQLGYVTKF